MTSETVIPFDQIDWDAMTRQLDEEHPETAAQVEEKTHTEQSQLIYDKLLLGQPITVVVPSKYDLKRLTTRICQLKKRANIHYEELIGDPTILTLTAKPITEKWSDTTGGPVVMQLVPRKTSPTFTILE